MNHPLNYCMLGITKIGNYIVSIYIEAKNPISLKTEAV